MLKKVLFFVVASSLSLFGCDQGDDNVIDHVREAVQDTDLQAKVFQSECNLEALDAILTGILSAGDAVVKSSREQFEFQGSSITHSTLVYQNSDCTGEAFTIVESGNFDVKDQTRADESRYIDIKYDELSVKIESQMGAEAANAINLCGVSDWGVENDREVTGQAGDQNCYGSALPRTVLNVYRLDDDGSTLMFGRPDAENRALGVHFSNKYTAR